MTEPNAPEVARPRRRRRLFAFASVLAISAGLGVVAPVVEASAADNLMCDGSTVYGVANIGATPAERLIGMDLTTTPIVQTQITVPGVPTTASTSTNQLGITAGGTRAVYTYNGSVIYNYEFATETLTSHPTWRIGNNNPSNANERVNGVAGAVNPANNLYYYGGVKTVSGVEVFGFAVYDPETDSAPGGESTAAMVTLPGNAPANNADIAFDQAGNLYIIAGTNATGGLVGRIYRVDGDLPTSNGGFTPLTATLLTTIPVAPSVSYAAVAFGANGKLIVGGGGSNVIEVDPTTGAWSTRALQSIGLNITDMASCASPSTIQVKKNLPDGRVAADDQFSLRITGPETFQGGATATTFGTESGVQEEVGEVAGPVFVNNGAQYTFTEQATGTSEYETTWQCVDKLASDPTAVIANGTGTTGTVTIPTGRVSAVECMFTNVFPDLEVAKDVQDADGNSIDGQSVQPGQTLNYVLTFENKGGASAPVDFTDDVSELVDDVTINGDPVSSDTDQLTASAISNNQFTVTGSVKPYSKVTVKYSATVKGVDRGDNSANNFVFPTGEEPPTECLADNPLCTVNPIPDLEVSKSVSPTSGTTVNPGETLTYTVTFRNSGQAATEVAYDDVISGVLDDADYVTGSLMASADSLTVSDITDGRFSVTGTLGAQETVTVTYRVVVKANADRNDNVLLNFVVPTGEEPPAECLPTNVLCTENPVPAITVTKDVDPADGSTVKAGETLTYTLTFKNTGAAAGEVAYDDVISGVLDDADYVAGSLTASPADGGLTVSDIADGRFSVTGSLATDSTVTVTYQVVVKADADRNDDVLLNFVVPTGEEPPAECKADDPLCTENPVPAITVTKDVDPSDGSTVNAGETLTYTLTFKNTGAAAGEVAYDDVISGVLDDADYVAGSLKASPADSGLTVSDITDGRFSVTGSLATDSTVTVTYQVVVKADADRNDNVLLNFVVPTGEEPPAECKADDPLCTENPVPAITVTKDVNPADGSTVNAGETLTYTIKFTNTGAAAGEVAYDDVISGVLDDADYVAGSLKASPADSGLTVSDITDGRFSVTGTLAGNATATVTYQVVVKADGARNDNVLLNFVVPTGEEPPAECKAGDSMCTENPVPQLVLEKSTSTKWWSKEGDVISYTFKITNVGAVRLTDVAVVDDKIDAPAVCEYTTLAPGESTDCTGSHAVTAEEAAAKEKIINTAHATGKDPKGKTVQSPPDSVEVPYRPLVLPRTDGALGLAGALALLVIGGTAAMAIRRMRANA